MQTLYHPEGISEVWGVTCKFKTFNSDEIEQALKDGWFESPLDFADKNGDGEIDIEEARAYAEENDLDVEGLHWKKVIKAVQEHMNDN